MVGSANTESSEPIPIPSSHYKSLEEYFKLLVDCGLCERVEPELAQQLQDFCTTNYAADKSSIASGADPATSIADLTDIATSQLPSTPGRISHSLLQEKMKDPAIIGKVRGMKQKQQWQPPRPENLGDLPLNDECQWKYEHLQRLQRRHDTALRELVQVQGEMVTASLDFLHLRNGGVCLESPVYMDGGGGGGGGGGGHARARDNGDVGRFRGGGGGGGFGQSRSYKKRGRGGRGENGEPSSTGGNFQRQ
ncbi:hypothetical protein LY78DRAFT_723063 [Colletotrichum sublineola]|nr:hypothetical protein LY78DRAFT_723063 [Colletotrichum sublineola]